MLKISCSKFQMRPPGNT